jgi:hypothetical protein
VKRYGSWVADCGQLSDAGLVPAHVCTKFVALSGGAVNHALPTQIIGVRTCMRRLVCLSWCNKHRHVRTMATHVVVTSSYGVGAGDWWSFSPRVTSGPERHSKKNKNKPAVYAVWTSVPPGAGSGISASVRQRERERGGGGGATDSPLEINSSHEPRATSHEPRATSATARRPAHGPYRHRCAASPLHCRPSTMHYAPCTIHHRP